MTIDTIFLCFCEDYEENDGMSRPYFMSAGLMEFVESSKSALELNNQSIAWSTTTSIIKMQSIFPHFILEFNNLRFPSFWSPFSLFLLSINAINSFSNWKYFSIRRKRMKKLSKCLFHRIDDEYQRKYAEFKRFHFSHSLITYFVSMKFTYVMCIERIHVRKARLCKVSNRRPSVPIRPCVCSAKQKKRRFFFDGSE